MNKNWQPNRKTKEHDQRLQTANKLHEQALMEERRRHSQLENEINKYQLKLKESNAALQAASRLSQQLHAKQETIDQLRTHRKSNFFLSLSFSPKFGWKF